MVVQYNEHMFNKTSGRDRRRNDIFIKSPEQKILSLFAMNPEISFYGREIAEKLGLSLGSVHAALLSLERSGFLIPRRIGKTRLFSLETTHPVIPAFRVLNSILVLDPLMESLKAISKRVILFGSYATGNFGPMSDVDVLIVSNEKDGVSKRIESFKRKSGLDIRPIIKNQIEWAKLEMDGTEFIEELDRGILLWERPVEESGF